MIRRCLRPLKKNAARTMQGPDSLKYLTDGQDLFVLTDDRQKILQAMERQFVLALGIGSLVRTLDQEARRTPVLGRQSRKAHGANEKGGRAA